MTDEQRDDLRSTAEAIVEDAEQLQQIEKRKLELEPEESETHELAVEADRLAKDIAHKARLERDIVAGGANGQTRQDGEVDNSA